MKCMICGLGIAGCKCNNGNYSHRARVFNKHGVQIDGMLFNVKKLCENGKRVRKTPISDTAAHFIAENIIMGRTVTVEKEDI